MSDFHEGLVPACQGGQMFHIDRNGQPAYKARYDWVGDFHEGLATSYQGDEEFQIRFDGSPAS